MRRVNFPEARALIAGGGKVEALDDDNDVDPENPKRTDEFIVRLGGESVLHRPARRAAAPADDGREMSRCVDRLTTMVETQVKLTMQVQQQYGDMIADLGRGMQRNIEVCALLQSQLRHIGEGHSPWASLAEKIIEEYKPEITVFAKQAAQLAPLLVQHLADRIDGNDE